MREKEREGMKERDKDREREKNREREGDTEMLSPYLPLPLSPSLTPSLPQLPPFMYNIINNIHTIK